MMGFNGIAKTKRRSRKTGLTKIVGVTGGQSNLAKWFLSPDTNGTEGKDGFLSVINAALPNGANNLISGATTGSSALKSSTVGTNWWYDDATQNFGPCYDTWLTNVTPVIPDVKVILWDQGEGDFGSVASGATPRANYKNGLLTIFNQMRSVVGNVPVIIIPLGRRTNVVAHTGWQNIREVQKELAAENSWIFLTPEKFDQILYDDVHYTAASYAVIGARAARKTLQVLGLNAPGADGPVLASSASRSRNIVTIDITHDAGSDMSPGTLMDGFRYVVDAAEVSLSAARADNNTIALTLSAEPAHGVEKLYYGYNVMNTVDPAKLVVDNAPNPLPLRSAVITSIAKTDIAPELPSAVFVHDATLAASYAGTGQPLYNTIELPGDSSLQSAYDAVLGSTANADGNDPVFNGSGQSAYFSSDGNDSLRIASPPDFLKNLAVSGSFSLAMFFRSPVTWSGTPLLFGCGGTSTTIAGLSVRYITTSNLLRIATSDGTAGANADITGSAVPADTDCAVIVTYNAATKAYTARVNSATTSLSGTGSNLKSTAAGAVPADSFSNFPSGSRFYRIALFNEVLDNAKARIVIDKANALHGRVYA